MHIESANFHGLNTAEEEMDTNQSDTLQSMYDLIGEWSYEITAADNQESPNSVSTNGSEFDSVRHPEESSANSSDFMGGTPSEPELIVPEKPDSVQLPSRGTTKKRKPTENSEEKEEVPSAKRRKTREIEPSQKEAKTSKNNRQNQTEALILEISELNTPLIE